MHESMTQMLLSFPYAILAGLLVASVCALLGVYVILKRVVFIGITLSEMAACGIAVAMLLGAAPFLGAIVLTLAGVAVLAMPFESRRIPRDAVLGVLFVAASSMSVLLVSGSGHGLQEIKSLLYGDLILTTPADLRVICGVLIPALAYLLLFQRPTLYAFLDREASIVLKVKPGRWELAFFLLLGLVVAVASKVAGTLLVFCYLIVPPTLALLLSRRLWLVMLLAVAFATSATLAGLCISFKADLPTNQTVCATLCGILALAIPVGAIRCLLRRSCRRAS
jgi:ABC-type Mn2+/Zn2+ transport system permease subunit